MKGAYSIVFNSGQEFPYLTGILMQFINRVSFQNETTDSKLENEEGLFELKFGRRIKNDFSIFRKDEGPEEIFEENQNGVASERERFLKFWRGVFLYEL